jgi:hypothetical protein
LPKLQKRSFVIFAASEKIMAIGDIKLYNTRTYNFKGFGSECTGQVFCLFFWQEL